MELEEKRQKRVADWIKKPSNLILISILILAAILRFHYAFVTMDQPLWWDEAEYGSTAKHWAYGVPFELNPQRPPLFSFMWAILLMLGSSEFLIKILLIVLPSIFLVFTVYLLGKEMFNKNVALIAALFTSVSWTFLFWTARFQPDSLSMCFQVLSILFMWRYWKGSTKNPSKTIILSGVFFALGFVFKISALLVPLTFFVFMLIKDRAKMFTNKHYYYFAIAAIITLLPYFIWSQIQFGTPTAFKSGYSSDVVNTAKPLGWYNLRFYVFLTTGAMNISDLTNSLLSTPINFIFSSTLFVLFILGVILAFKFIFYIDVLIKDRKKCFSPEIFSILIFLVVSAFYIFYIKGTEDRWVFLWMPFIFFFAAETSVRIHSYLKKLNNFLAIIVTFVLILAVAYSQITYATGLIDIKKDTYVPVKLAGEWMKEHSDKSDIILSISSTQNTYYSERESETYSAVKTAYDFDSFISEINPRYIEVSIFEPHPNWISEWIQNNQEGLVPVQTYYADQEKTKAALVVFQKI